MTAEESVHYQWQTEIGDIEWATVLPRGKGIVRLPGDSRYFRLALFHQLECLNVVRGLMIERIEGPLGASASAKAHFCLNYLRQSVQCQADTRLELVVRSASGSDGSVQAYTTRTDCKDWEHIRDAAEKNYDDWKNGELR